MAKLNKEKFHMNGVHMEERTTSSGDIELQLHYDTTHHYFYFDKKEIEERLPHTIGSLYQPHTLFNTCDSREKAIEVIKTLIGQNVTETRMLRIELSIPRELYMINNPSHVPKQLGSDEKIINPEYAKFVQEMLARSGHASHTMGINFERIIKYDNGKTSLYCKCDSNWNASNNYLSSLSFNLIEWSPEIELFLVQTQQQIDDMCKKVLSFFNTKDISELTQRMTSSTKLIP